MNHESRTVNSNLEFTYENYLWSSKCFLSSQNVICGPQNVFSVIIEFYVPGQSRVPGQSHAPGQFPGSTRAVSGSTRAVLGQSRDLGIISDKVLSSANFDKNISFCWDFKSFIIINNNQRPKRVPCGTPAGTFNQLE